MNQPSTRVLAAAAAAVGAVLGVVAGVVLEDRRDLVTTAQEDRDEPVAPLAVGAVTDALNQPRGERDFELPVYNASEVPLKARLSSLEGMVDTVDPEPATSVSPGSWGRLGFSVVANCDTGAAGAIHHTRLSVSGDDAPDEVRLALPDLGKVLVDYHRDVCRSAPAEASDQIAGVWIVDRAYGEDLQGFLGVMLWRFGRDGSFAADPEGGLFTDDQGVFGTYRVQGDLLTIDVEGGYGCGAAGEVVWRLALVGNDRMSLGWIRGTCPDGQPGDVWVMRRVLLDRGLPGPP